MGKSNFMKKANHSAHGSRPAWIRTCLTALGMSAAAGAMAQPVFIEPPTAPESQPATSQPTDSEATAGSESSSASGPASARSLQQPFQWRKLTFRPHVSYQFMYGNDILSRSNQSHETIIQTISPGMLMELGKHWTLDYTPSLAFYSDKNFKNSLNHSLNLSGHTSYEDWTYALGFNGNLTFDPNTQTGQQTDQQTYAASLSASRQLNGKLSLDLSGSLNFHLANEFNSSRDYSTMEWLNYQWAPTLGFGVGVGYGYETTTLNGDSMHEHVLARVVWQIIDRVSFSLNAGPEFRQFLDSDKSPMISGTFGSSLSCQLTRATSLSLNANRSTGSSLLQNQFTETTSVAVSLSQRFFSRYFAAVSGGYTFTDYQSSQNDSTGGRSDQTRFLSVSLGTSFMKRGSASIFYSLSQNETNEKGLGYSSNQVGASVSYRY